MRRGSEPRSTWGSLSGLERGRLHVAKALHVKPEHSGALALRGRVEELAAEKARAVAAGVNSVGMEMVRIRAGSFEMGPPSSELNRGKAERRHRVRLKRDYLLSSTEVTQGQWQAVMGEKPSRFKGEDLPVESVSWIEAVEFCNKLSERERLTPAYRISGKRVDWDRSSSGYRLPTESEWEYGCRAGSSTRFWSGDSDSGLGRAGWYSSNSGGRPHPVGGMAANPLGLFDVHGNVWEWCWDIYSRYPSGSATDPSGPSKGAYRVERGGSWSSRAQFCRSASRARSDPGLRYDNLGLRPARSTP